MNHLPNLVVWNDNQVILLVDPVDQGFKWAHWGWLVSVAECLWPQLGRLRWLGPRTIWWSRKWHPTPVVLPGKSHGRRSLVDYSRCGRKESDTTERLHFHFSLSCIGEGNGNPLQYSFLENPRDGGAQWAAIYRVTQSQTQLKQCSSSSRRTIWRFLHSCFWHLSRDDSKSGLSWDRLLENRLCDWGSSLYGGIKVVRCLT